jgi:hypothetical protein
MSNIHRTASGRSINMDMMRLANENIIAIGNMHTNARGDELSKGGKIAKTRSQIMQEYYGLNVPVADDTPLEYQTPINNIPKTQLNYETPVIIPDDKKILDDNLDGDVDANYTKPRGSLADSVAQETEITQTLLKPLNKKDGIQRI